MSTHDPLAPPTRDPGAQEGSGKTEQVRGAAQQEGRELAGSASQEAHSVGETAKEQAGHVAEEAKGEARELLTSATSRLEDQAEEQTHKLADALRSAGDQARALAEGRTDEAGEADRYVRQVAGTLNDIAERIDRLGVRGSIDELQQFARRRPGAFLAGAAAAGLLASRFARNSGNGSQGTSGSPGRQSTAEIPPVTTRASGPTTAPPRTPPAAPPAAPPATPPTTPPSAPSGPAVRGTPPDLQNTGGPTGGPGTTRGPEVR